ncbi:hypothetical protein F53441_10765 [Fusarium austroafricanum]|uniref:Uncharacterized protein n=1 Tax=Fusarium austroafricanum TaxID=2364996 RepID=A0A8H4K854_9HYPO|nr:hypothetical protein F53441_10765 [Fusarium austroafricanum]
MDELISINEQMARLSNWHNLPEVVAEVQKINERRQRADYLIKASRENTEGGIRLDETIENVIWEKVELKRKYNEKVAENAREWKRLQERWAAAVQSGPPAAARDPFSGGSLPTPAPTRNSAVHESQDRAYSERKTIRDSQSPLVDDEDDNDAEPDPDPDPTANDEQPTPSAPRRPRRPLSEAPADINPPPKRTHRSDNLKPLTPRSIEFDEVFQNGEPNIIYKIVRIPSCDGYWYILECKDCGIPFLSEDVVEKAGKHWNNVHSEEPVTLEQAIGQMGTQVLNCTVELAERNNALGTEDQTSHKEPARASASTNARKKKGKRGRPRLLKAWKMTGGFKDVDPRIINAKPGDIVCQVGGHKVNYFYPAMVLPWGPFELFGWAKTLEEKNLNAIIPECYHDAKETDTTPPPWAPGYEDNGDQAHRREIPVVYFRGQQDFPHECQAAWVPLNKLKVYNESCTRTKYKDAVKAYLDDWPESSAEGTAAREAGRVSQEVGETQDTRKMNVTTGGGRRRRHSHTRPCTVVHSIERDP